MLIIIDNILVLFHCSEMYSVVVDVDFLSPLTP